VAVDHAMKANQGFMLIIRMIPHLQTGAGSNGTMMMTRPSHGVASSGLDAVTMRTRCLRLQRGVPRRGPGTTARKRKTVRTRGARTMPRLGAETHAALVHYLPKPPRLGPQMMMRGTAATVWPRKVRWMAALVVKRCSTWSKNLTSADSKQGENPRRRDAQSRKQRGVKRRRLSSKQSLLLQQRRLPRPPRRPQLLQL